MADSLSVPVAGASFLMSATIFGPESSGLPNSSSRDLRALSGPSYLASLFLIFTSEIVSKIALRANRLFGMLSMSVLASVLKRIKSCKLPSHFCGAERGRHLMICSFCFLSLMMTSPFASLSCNRSSASRNSSSSKSL